MFSNTVVKHLRTQLLKTSQHLVITPADAKAIHRENKGLAAVKKEVNLNVRLAAQDRISTQNYSSTGIPFPGYLDICQELTMPPRRKLIGFGKLCNRSASHVRDGFTPRMHEIRTRTLSAL